MKLTLQDICKNFGEKQVLKKISFSVCSGKAFGLLGRNGAGKTTTIRILMNVFPAESGEILINDKPINYSEIGMGYLPEERGLYPKKKIVEQLVYLAQLKGMKKGDANRSVDYWLNKLEMMEYRDKKLDSLSKGNQQKIQLITALAHNPKIIILDEPFSGLDPVNAIALKNVISEEIANDKIVLFSSHQMNYVEEFCDSIAIINEGEIALQGDLREIKRNYTRDKLIVYSKEADKIHEESGISSNIINKEQVIIQLATPNDKQKMMSLLTSKYDIDEIKVYEPSLNDIFVEYTESRKKEKIG